MNELETFRNSEFGEVRTIIKDGEPWFIANEIAETLGYSNPSKATNDHCKHGVTWWGNDSLGRRQPFKIIPESDIYRLIIKSKLPNAERFETWIVEEVLPSIRKNGGYIYGQETLNDDELIIRALQVANNRITKRNAIIEQQTRKINELESKAAYADAVAASDNSILVRDFAHMLKQNGVDIGEKRLFNWFREKGYMYKGSREPTQRALNLGLFEIQQHIIQTDKGEKITRTTRITGKGQVYFTNMFLNPKTAQNDKAVIIHA